VTAVAVNDSRLQGEAEGDDLAAAKWYWIVMPALSTAPPSLLVTVPVTEVTGAAETGCTAVGLSFLPQLRTTRQRAMPMAQDIRIRGMLIDLNLKT
jgi:hypothetical protein